jgi:hypothetical protein
MPPILPGRRIKAVYFVILDVDPVEDAVLRIPDWPLRQLGVAVEDAFNSCHAIDSSRPVARVAMYRKRMV